MPSPTFSLAELVDDNPLRTVDDLCDKYQLEILPRKALKTQKSHAKYLARFRAGFRKIPPKSILPRHIVAHSDHRAKVAPTTANRELELIKHLLGRAVEWGAIDANPAAGSGRCRYPNETAT